MRVLDTKYGIEMTLEENRVSTLVVENPMIMSEMVRDLLCQINGEAGEWILSESDKMFPIAKTCVLIDNPLMVNCNDKRVLSKLYKELAEHMKAELYEEYTQVNAKLLSFLEQLLHLVPYHLDMEPEVDPTAILKTYGVKMMVDGVSLLENLLDYLRAMSSICGIRVVWLLNAKQFLSMEEIQQLYEFCFYEKIFLINLEGQKNYSLEQEKCVIIDRDLCLIDSSAD